MTRNDHHLLLHAHENSAPVCAAKLVAIARRVPRPPPTISAFVADIVSSVPTFAIPSDSKQLAIHCARRISELATARRKTVAQLLNFHNVGDSLERFRVGGGS